MLQKIESIIKMLKEKNKNLSLNREITLLEEVVQEYSDIEYRSLVWSVYDFIYLNEDKDFQESLEQPMKISRERALLAVYDMVRQHNAEYGITWDTVHKYYKEYADKI